MYNPGLPYYFLYQFRPCGWIFVLMLILTSSCKKNFSSDQFEDDKLVVLAEITALNTVKIPIGKTIKVGNGSLIRFEKVNDATVTLTEANSMSWVLQPNYSQQYASNPTSVFTNRKRFKPNTIYNIEIKHPTLGTVTASTYIPNIPMLIETDTASDVYNDHEVLAVDISWKDSAGIEEYYIIEALKEIVKLNHYYFYQNKRYNYDSQQGLAFYQQVVNTVPGGIRVFCDTLSSNKYIRLNVYTEDDNSENSHIDKLTNSFRRIFFTDQSFSGEEYSTRVYIDKQFFTNPTQKGRVRLQLKSVSKEFYNYLKLYEKYKTDFGSVPANQLLSPTGNIQNGLGIFGGSAKRERVFYFDTLL